MSVAVSCETEVGVDVETPAPMKVDVPSRMVFHPQDRLDTDITTENSRFYTAWTLKEAITKCDGRGLSLPFNQLRLEHVSSEKYLGYYKDDLWYAQNFRLPDGAYLSYASNAPTEPLRIILTDIS